MGVWVSRCLLDHSRSGVSLRLRLVLCRGRRPETSTCPRPELPKRLQAQAQPLGHGLSDQDQTSPTPRRNQWIKPQRPQMNRSAVFPSHSRLRNERVADWSCALLSANCSYPQCWHSNGLPAISIGARSLGTKVRRLGLNPSGSCSTSATSQSAHLKKPSRNSLPHSGQNIFPLSWFY